jgi:hypothetical protein
MKQIKTSSLVGSSKRRILDSNNPDRRSRTRSMNKNLREMSYSDELPAASRAGAMNHRSVAPEKGQKYEGGENERKRA